MYPAQIIAALKTVIHPEKGQNIYDLGMVEDDIRINGKKPLRPSRLSVVPT